MDFNDSLNFVLSKEGGLSNDASDHGGLTKYGISAAAHPNVDIKSLTPDSAAKIYKAEYWNSIGADSLPDNMKTLAFDTAVQHGPAVARKMIEASGGDPSKIVDARSNLYQQIIQNNPSQAKFANGWANRLNSAAETIQAAPAPAPAPPITDPLQANIAKLFEGGANESVIMNALDAAGHGEELQYATSRGFTPTQIIEKFGGAPLAAATAARDKVRGQSFVENTYQGAKGALSDMGSGGQQLLARASGDDARLAELQGQAAADQADPTRIALGNTMGGAAGNFGAKVLPYIAAGAATGGAGVVPGLIGQAAVGAVDGALTPTTGAGQIGSNIMSSAALAAVGGAAGAGLGKLAGKVFGAAGSKLTAKAGVAAADPAAAQGALAEAVGNKVGVPGATAINQDMIHAADAVYKPMFDAAAAGNTVTVPAGFGAKLAGAAENLNTVPKQLQNLIAKAADGETISAERWIKYRSDIGADARGAAGSDRMYLGDVVSHLDDALTSSSSLSNKQLADLASAREIYRNLQPLEALVAKSSNSGIITPAQFKASISSAGTDSVSRGGAPLQDLQHLVDQLKSQSALDKIADNTNPILWNGLMHGADLAGMHTVGMPLGSLVMGGGVALKKLGPDAMRIAGSGLSTAGNGLSNAADINALIGSLVAKGLGPSGTNK